MPKGQQLRILGASHKGYFMSLKTPRKTIYIKAAFYVVLMLVAGFFLVIFFIGGIVGAIITGDYALLAGGSLFFILFLLVGAIAKRFESAWEQFEQMKGIQPKTTREAFKDSLPFVLILLLVLVFAYVFETYFLSFPLSISPSLAREMLKSILTIDGILIGFYGIILAQFLWAIHSKGNVIYEQMIVHRNDNDTMQNLNDEVRRLSRTKMVAIGSVFYSMMPLLASILLCLNKLPMTESNDPIATRTLILDPLLALIAGIMLLSITTLQISLLPWTTEKIKRKKRTK